MIRVYIFYYLTLGLLFSFSFFPEWRVWGINLWAYFSLWSKITLLGIGAIAPFFVHWLIRDSDFNLAKCHQKYTIMGTFVAVGMAISFFYLKAKTFFLGDGYTLISLLTNENPILEKERNLGESLLHIYLYKLIDGNSESDAIVVFQSVSILAGLLYMSVLYFLTTKLFVKRTSGLTFFTGMATCGNMLLFFGYAENYSLFSVSILCYSMISILIVQKNLNRFWIILVQALIIFFHVFGLVLLPATLVLLFHDTKMHDLYKNLSKTFRIVTLSSILLIAIVLFLYKFYTDLFFQLAFVPVIATQFTVEGYTLFSYKHFLDMVNLILLLASGILVLIALLINLKLRELFNKTESKILILISILCLGAVFVIDPKLGMPRDWDLFAFSMIPVTVLIFYSLMKHNLNKKTVVTVLLSSVLGLLFLLPRAYSLTQPDIALKHFKNYQNLDVLKNKTSWKVLSEFHKSRGEDDIVEQVNKEWQEIYPEANMMSRAHTLYYKDRDPQKAVAVIRNVIKTNPIYAPGYSFMGLCLIDLNLYDSSLVYLNYSEALNPFNAIAVSNKGVCYQYQKKYEQAEYEYKRAIELEKNNAILYYNLASLYRETNKSEVYEETLIKSFNAEKKNKVIEQELVEYYLKKNDLNKARFYVTMSEFIKEDTQFLQVIRLNYPGF